MSGPVDNAVLVINAGSAGAAFANPDLRAALRVPLLSTSIMNSNRIYDDLIRLIESLEPADHCSEAPQQE